MPVLSDMFDLAYKKERAAARKLQRDHGLSEEQALLDVLRRSAVEQPLEAMLAERRQSRAIQAGKLQARRERQQQTARHARRHAASYPADAWLGWFDGSAHPNPGRMRIGAVLQAPDGRSIEIGSDAGHGDSSEAEYLALHALLEAAITHKVTQLVVHGDSRVVIDDVLACNGRTARILAPYRVHALALMAQVQEIRLLWIPRHRNGRADALSQRGAHRLAQEATGAASLSPFLAAAGETQ